jgi:hypothetical protein
MQRREFLKALIGCAAGAAALVTAAEAMAAMPVAPAPDDAAKPDPNVKPAIADKDEAEGMRPELVRHRHYHRYRRHWRRRRVYVYHRPRRHHWRRRYWRRRYW